MLLSTNPFVDATPILYQWLYNRLSEGDHGLYCVNNRPPDIVIQEMEAYGWPVAPFKERETLAFVDAYSGILKLRSDEAFCVEDPTDVQQISRTVLKAMGGVVDGAVTLFFDSLNTLLDQCRPGVLGEVENWCKFCIAHDVSSVYVFTEWGYPHEVTVTLEKMFDNIIELKALRRIVASEALTVSKVQRAKVEEKRMVPFRYVKPGGLRLYVPKVLVTGPYSAGKTTLVHGLSAKAVSVQRMGTTIALDFGHVDYKGFSVDLFGTVGQERFDPILEQLGGESLGVILVVDSTRPVEFPRAMEMMHKAGVYGFPFIVVANKQDLPDALSKEEIRKRMHIPDDVTVIETVATEKKNIFTVLDALLKKLAGGK